MKPTVITLSPSNGDSLRVATFEEAFGEYSELRGRGRARRAKRRADRQAKKRQRQADRQETRRQKRATRIANRAERKRSRQAMRAEQQEARQTRKDVRKQRRMARKAMGEVNDGMTENTSTEMEESQNTPQTQGGYSEETQGGYAEETATQGGSQESTPRGGGFAYGEDEGYEEGNYEEGEEGGYEGEDEGYESEEDYGFDGDNFSFANGQVVYPDENTGAEDSYGTTVWGAEDYFLNADGRKQKINPKVQDAANRIEWNKQLVTRLKSRQARSQDPIEGAKLDAEISNRANRIIELESKLDGYAEFKGRGKGGRKAQVNAMRETKKARINAKRAHSKEARAARKAARLQKREQVRNMRPNRGMGRGMGLGLGKRRRGVTEVEQGLPAEFGDNRIEIDAEPMEQFSGANGDTGYIGVDNRKDFDAPAARKFDLKFSSADGQPSGRKIELKHVLIGLAIGVVAIYAIKKFTKK